MSHATKTNVRTRSEHSLHSWTWRSVLLSQLDSTSVAWQGSSYFRTQFKGKGPWGTTGLVDQCEMCPYRWNEMGDFEDVEITAGFHHCLFDCRDVGICVLFHLRLLIRLVGLVRLSLQRSTRALFCAYALSKTSSDEIWRWSGHLKLDFRRCLGRRWNEAVMESRLLLPLPSLPPAPLRTVFCSVLLDAFVRSSSYDLLRPFPPSPSYLAELCT